MIPHSEGIDGDISLNQGEKKKRSISTFNRTQRQLEKHFEN
jgi:hypothetical protein